MPAFCFLGKVHLDPSKLFLFGQESSEDLVFFVKTYKLSSLRAEADKTGATLRGQQQRLLTIRRPWLTAASRYKLMAGLNTAGWMPRCHRLLPTAEPNPHLPLF